SNTYPDSDAPARVSCPQQHRRLGCGLALCGMWPSLDEARGFLRSGTGRGVKIAVLDSGVEANHPFLNGVVLVDDLAIIDDGMQLKAGPGGGGALYGHGTAIAGIIHTLAPEAEIGSFRVLGEQLRSRSAIIREGVRQALDRGYQVLNCSFGCG